MPDEKVELKTEGAMTEEEFIEDAEIAYGAYRDHTGGISLASGQPIPEWPALRPEIQAAWKASSVALRKALFCPPHADMDAGGILQPFDNCVACIRAERNSMKAQLAESRASEARLMEALQTAESRIYALRRLHPEDAQGTDGILNEMERAKQECGLIWLAAQRKLAAAEELEKLAKDWRESTVPAGLVSAHLTAIAEVAWSARHSCADELQERALVLRAEAAALLEKGA